MKTTIKNQDYFNGLIQGVVAMYKLGEYLSDDLNIKWRIEFTDNKKANIFCEYSSCVRNVLTNPGDDDFAPEYKVIDIREVMNINIDNIEDTDHIIDRITTGILAELPSNI